MAALLPKLRIKALEQPTHLGIPAKPDIHANSSQGLQFLAKVGLYDKMAHPHRRTSGAVFSADKRLGVVYMKRGAIASKLLQKKSEWPDTQSVGRGDSETRIRRFGVAGKEGGPPASAGESHRQKFEQPVENWLAQQGLNPVDRLLDMSFPHSAQRSPLPVSQRFPFFF